MASEIVRVDEVLEHLLDLPATTDLEAGWASISVADDANAPELYPDDVLAVDRDVTGFIHDGLYVVEVGGEPLIRFVQERTEGLRVYALNESYAALPAVQAQDLRVLGKCRRAARWRSHDQMMADYAAAAARP